MSVKNGTLVLSFVDITKVFWYGLKMDLAATGYLLLLPGLALVFTPLVSNRIFMLFVHSYTLLFSIFLSSVTIIDLELFRHWGYRLDITPFRYIGRDTLSSSAPSTVILQSLSIVFLVFFTLLLYRFLTKKIVAKFNSPSWKYSPVFLLATSFLILPIRGGLDVSPMNIGTVFFHKKNPFANLAAINLFWNFGDSITKAIETNKYPENLIEKAEVDQVVQELYRDKGKTEIIIKDTPNVILLILESFTAKIIEPLGGMAGVTPEINALCKEGILFDNFYASGSRTDKGIISILSAYPAQPKSSIITYTQKSEKLPKLTHSFIEQGYYTTFIYGGNTNFANINAYLAMSNFDNIISKNDFPSELSTSKWGIHDHIIFDSAFTYQLSTQQPFFTSILSLSSHEPFDVPLRTPFYGNSEEQLYLNSAYYTDREVGKFINQLKNSLLWDNTLIIITADHGTRHPHNTMAHEREKYKIPMLWLGGALKKQGVVTTKYASQTDIAATLLTQLQLNSSQFTYSKNILSEGSSSFSFYAYNNGFGFIGDSTDVIYDLNTNKTITEDNNFTELKRAKAYMQSVFSDFNKK